MSYSFHLKVGRLGLAKKDYRRFMGWKKLFGKLWWRLTSSPNLVTVEFYDTGDKHPLKFDDGFLFRMELPTIPKQDDMVVVLLDGQEYSGQVQRVNLLITETEADHLSVFYQCYVTPKPWWEDQ